MKNGEEIKEIISKQRGLSASVSSLPLPLPHFHFLALVSFLARPKPRIPFLGLSLLRNLTKTLATQAILLPAKFARRYKGIFKIYYFTGHSIPKRYLSLQFSMTIEPLKSPNPRNRNSISVIKSKFLSVSSMNTLLAILKVSDARHDVILAGGLYKRFPQRHLPPLMLYIYI